MAISATMLAGEQELKQDKKIKNEVPLIELVPVKIPLREMTLDDKKKQIMEEKEPFYVATVFDGSTSTSAYLGMVRGISTKLQTDFEGNLGSELSSEFLPTSKFGKEDAKEGSFYSDRDNYAKFFENLLQSTLNNCALIIYGDLDPGGQGAVDPLLVDDIVEELKKRNIKIYIVFLEDKAQERQEDKNLKYALKNWETNLRSAKRKGKVELNMKLRDDKGKDIGTGVKTFTAEQCQAQVDEVKQCIERANTRVETMEKICSGTGGKLIMVQDAKLTSFKKNNITKRQEYEGEVQSLILDVIISEQGEGGK